MLSSHSINILVIASRQRTDFDNHRLLSFTLNVAGGSRQLQGQWDEAQLLYEESVALARKELSDRNYLATALLNLGEVVQLKDETDRAAEFIRESLRIFSEMNVRNAVAYCLELLAAIDSTEGRFEEAAQLFGAADRIREDIGTPIESFNLERYNRDLNSTKDMLGAKVFEKSWEEGRQMKSLEAVEIAMLDFT